MEAEAPLKKPRNGIDQPLILVLSILFILANLAIILNRAWVSDDSYITFRVVENFASGYGPRWNTAERVQVFTHPLWMLLMTFLYLFTEEVYLSSIFLSISFSMLTIIIFFLMERKNSAVWIGLIAMSFSSAYVDYSTSGLENALSHALMMAFLFFYLRFEDPRKNTLALSFLAGLICLNRLDYILFFIPLFGYFLWEKGHRWKTVLEIGLGFVPIIGWLLFSTVYYGFPLPNTFYAKLGNWLPRSALIHQGWKYFLHTLQNDPITGLILLLGVIMAVIHPSKKRILMTSGGILFFFYVLWIGGDFMEGRFFTVLFLVFLVFIVHDDFHKLKSFHYSWIFGLLLVLNLLSSIPTFASRNWEFVETWQDGIVNERYFYARETALFRKGVFHTSPNHPWRYEGEMLKRACDGWGKCYVPLNSVGFAGFYAGPDVYIVDRYGLGSALMARIPPEITSDWRIGHFIRELPDGYLEYLKTEDIHRIPDPEIQAYINKLEVVTKGPIFTTDRISLIYQFGVGQIQYPQ